MFKTKTHTLKKEDILLGLCKKTLIVTFSILIYILLTLNHAQGYDQSNSDCK